MLISFVSIMLNRSRRLGELLLFVTFVTPNITISPVSYDAEKNFNKTWSFSHPEVSNMTGRCTDP
jgi:hypothetical protein